MIYKLRNGYRVISRKVGERTEFQTLNPQGETISSVVQNREAARETIIHMRVAAGLRRLGA